MPAILAAIRRSLRQKKQQLWKFTALCFDKEPILLQQQQQNAEEMDSTAKLVILFMQYMIWIGNQSDIQLWIRNDIVVKYDSDSWLAWRPISSVQFAASNAKRGRHIDM
jgi:hypothetical protein